MNRLYLEIIGSVVLFGMAIGWWHEHNVSEQKIGVAACETKLTEARNTYEKRERKQDDDYHQQTEKADATRIAEIAAIPVSHTPVFLCSNAAQVRARSVSLPPSTESEHTTGGGIVSGPGGHTDLRPYISALEVKYETALADCRAVIAEWPKN